MSELNVPNSAFGWVFVLVLLSILSGASYFDLRYLTIPNRLTVPTLFAGFIVNIIRLGWIGSENHEAFAGGMNGFLFALLGFLLGFGLFFFFWLIGLCGGGDLKLFAAVASWFGWHHAYWLWLTSFILLLAILCLRGLIQIVVRRSKTEQTIDTETAKPAAKPLKRRGLLPYALPLTIATVIVCWLYRAELKL